MPTKEVRKSGKKWRAEGWLSLSLQDFGLGLHLYKWRGGLAVNIYFLFLDFHLEVWKRP